MPRLATWTASGSNREPSPCKGVALPVGASSPLAAVTGHGGGGGTAAASRCSRYGHVNLQPRRGGSQGPQELNPPSACFGGRLPIRWLIPMKTKTALRIFLGRLPGSELAFYMGALPSLIVAGWEHG